MSARGRDLQCQPPPVLPDHITQVGDHDAIRGQCRVDDDLLWLLTPPDGLVTRHQVTQVAPTTFAHPSEVRAALVARRSAILTPMLKLQGITPPTRST